MLGLCLVSLNTSESYSGTFGSMGESSSTKKDTKHRFNHSNSKHLSNRQKVWLDRAAMSVKQKFATIMSDHDVDEREIIRSWLERSMPSENVPGTYVGPKGVASLTTERSFVTMQELQSFSLTENCSHNTRPRKLLLCRILPFPALRTSKISSSVPCSSSNARQRMSLLAKDDTGDLPCIVTNSSRSCLAGYTSFPNGNWLGYAASDASIM